VVSLVLSAVVERLVEPVHLFLEILRNVVVLERPEVGQPPRILVAQSPIRGEIVFVQNEQRAPHVVQLEVQFLCELLVGHFAVRRCRSDGHPLGTDQLVQIFLDYRILEQVLKSHYLHVTAWSH